VNYIFKIMFMLFMLFLAPKFSVHYCWPSQQQLCFSFVSASVISWNFASVDFSDYLHCF